MEEGAQVQTRRKQRKQLQSEKSEREEGQAQNTGSPLNVSPDDTVVEQGGTSKLEETISLAIVLQELRDFRREFRPAKRN